ATSAKKCASHPFMNPSAKLRKRRRNLAELGPEILEDTVGGGPKLPGFERECVREGQRTIPEECLERIELAGRNRRARNPFQVLKADAPRCPRHLQVML